MLGYNTILYRFLFICLALFSLQNSLRAGAGEDFAKALELHQAQKYGEAIALYDSVLAQGVSSAELHNNLGLAYLDSKNIGKAVLHFEKALHLSPNHEAASHNLLAAQSRVTALPKGIATSAIASFWLGLAGIFSANMWAILSLILVAVASGAWYAMAGRAKWLTIGASIFFLLFALLFGAIQSSQISNSKKVVLMKPKVGLRQQAGLQAQEVDFIYEGTTCQVIDEDGEWLRVQLANGLAGWIPAQLMEKV
jgi:tetratricopeptide (TPR) repeat protein